ncbi:MarR family transcriptional regulator [Rhodococcus sp. D2-41]|uniref:MarR family transcriptional regulator n=1 Tax=Speluncibacter jeojiensis TaxID=2710754 RepID=A0A9X4M233_9ACTN|nr:MarR family transcriptional regulator [Rhodococcus sp. D2-41]MDG3012741.1 MarR family transcriptional regulator [Rhodococcus sp. D2-41]MDG3015419.1 MarR family transcriptional regulator [Corynebacteriales bacterium D3-21]
MVELVAGIEYELTLLSRHYIRARMHSQDQHLDRSAYVILGRLELEGLMSLKELATALRLDISTVNRQVGALVRHKLVDRVPDPDGGLARKIRATDEGLAALRLDRRASRAGIARVVDGWNRADLDRLRDGLLQFNTGIEALEGNIWPRPDEPPVP